MSLLQMARGDMRTFTVTVTDKQTGEPVDLVTAELTFTAKRRYMDAPFMRKTLGDGLELGGSGDIGVVDIIIYPEDTEDLTHTERFVWDLEIDDGGEPYTLFRDSRLVVQLDASHAGGSGS